MRPRVTTPSDAAEFAAAQVAAARDDPAERLALLRACYGGPFGASPRHRPFRRAALSFMGWELRRGVLAPASDPRPGSPWWRALNERLLQDGCESLARAGGRGGEPSSETIEPWLAFAAEPNAANWYRAHNASIVAAYLEHRELAEQENRAERFFLNVVLLRVLYAHALVAAPRLALGRLQTFSRPLGDPRLGMAGIFLSLRRTVPATYPLPDPLEEYLRAEAGIGRTLDYVVIRPRLQRLYEWSAAELGLPSLRALIHDGAPVYAWPVSERGLFERPLRPARTRGLPGAYWRAASRSSSDLRRPGRE
ncbi:MAG: hypothetical protein WAL22_02515 [Solirubrobacteraceae bacterium]